MLNVGVAKLRRVSLDEFVKDYSYLKDFIFLFRSWRNEPKWFIERRIFFLGLFLKRYYKFLYDYEEFFFKDDLLIDFELVFDYIKVFGEVLFRMAQSDVQGEFENNLSVVGSDGFLGSAHCLNNEGIRISFDSELNNETVSSSVKIVDLRSTLVDSFSFLSSGDWLLNYEENLYSLFISALWMNGLYVKVDSDFSSEGYFHLNFVMSNQFPLQLNYILIDVGENSKVNFVEECVISDCLNNGDEFLVSNFHYGYSKMNIGSFSEVNYFSFGDWDDSLNLGNLKSVNVNDNGSLFWRSIIFGTKSNLFFPQIFLSGKNSSCVYSDTVVGEDSFQLVNPLFSIDGVNCNLFVQSKSILVGKGLSFFGGRFIFEECSYNYKSFIECDALLLNDKGLSSISSPELVMRSGNGSVNHEAKVGFVSKEKVFYLMNRGFSEKEAINLVISGYVFDSSVLLPKSFKKRVDDKLKSFSSVVLVSDLNESDDVRLSSDGKE